MKRTVKSYLGVGIVLTIVVLIFTTLGIRSLSDDSLKIPKSLNAITSAEVVFDPLQANKSPEFFTVSLTSASLLEVDKKNGVKPLLAESFELSSDASSVEVDLGDATFSNGEQVTAADVKATFSRLAATEVAYRNLLSNIQGFGEAKTGKDFFGISEVSDDVVKFSLITPDPYFLFRLTHPATSIISKKAMMEDGTLDHTISSGKYTIESLNNEIGKTTTYTPRNENMPIVNIAKKAQSGIESNTLTSEVIFGINNSNNYTQVSIPQLALATWNIYVGNGTSPLGDVRFRKALLLSISTKDTIAPYGSRAVEPSDFGGGTFDATNCSRNCESDIEEAQQIIKELYPDGNTPTINIDIEGNDIQKELAASAANDLSKIGITTVIREHSAAELSNSIARGEVQLYRFGWVSDIAVLGTGIVAGFKSDSPDNIAGIADIKLEEKIEDYLNAKTLSSRRRASIAVQDRLKDLWVVRPIAVFQDVISVDKSISELKVDFYGRIDMESLRIETE